MAVHIVVKDWDEFQYRLYKAIQKTIPRSKFQENHDENAEEVCQAVLKVINDA